MLKEIISVTELTKVFGGHVAVDHVSLKIDKGSFVSVIGPNGAGKTTFFNMISGQLPASSGKIFFEDQDITSLTAHKRALLGLGRSFQLTNLFPNLSALENVQLAVQARKAKGYKLLIDRRFEESLRALAMESLRMVQLEDKFTTPASVLTHGEKRKLELAIIMAMGSKVLLLDEPTAGMSVEEVPAILKVLKDIKNRGDKTIVLVEHKMDMVISLSDRIMVLHNGRLLNV